MKRYKVRKNRQIFYHISNLLMTFQMPYIYHQVAIPAYKILIKNNYNIVTNIFQPLGHQRIR